MESGEIAAWSAVAENTPQPPPPTAANSSWTQPLTAWECNTAASSPSQPLRPPAAAHCSWDERPPQKEIEEPQDLSVAHSTPDAARPSSTASPPPTVAEVEVRFDHTRKGERSLVVNGYKFTKSRNGAFPRVFWRCSKRACRATASSDGDVVLQANLVHSHPPPPESDFFLPRAGVARQRVRVSDATPKKRRLNDEENTPPPALPQLAGLPLFTPGSFGKAPNIANQDTQIMQQHAQLVVKQEEEVSDRQKTAEDFCSEFLSIEREKLHEIRRHHATIEAMLQKNFELLKEITKS